MKVSDLLDAETILLDPVSSDKNGLIREMIGLLADKDRLRSPKKALADVLEREKEKGTGLEHGVAVPHCRSEGAEKLVSAFALARAGIDFGAADGEPSRFIFLLISPKNATTVHVQALATMARVLKQREVQEKLLEAKGPLDVEKTLLEAKS